MGREERKPLRQIMNEARRTGGQERKTAKNLCRKRGVKGPWEHAFAHKGHFAALFL